MAYKQKKSMIAGTKPVKKAKEDKFLKEQREEAVKSTDYLTKTPNATTKAVKVDHSKTLSTHLDSRGSIKGDHEMENKGDFNISNLHKDTKISLDKKKKTNKKRSRKANEQERIEDAKGL